MYRLRTAVIFGTLSLAAYFFAAGLTAILTGRSTALQEVLLPLSQLDGLFSESLGGSDIARDLPVVCSLWLAFVCIVDLSVLLSSVRLGDFAHAFTKLNSQTRRLLIGLHLIAGKHPSGL